MTERLKVLIIGGSGLISTALTRELVRRDLAVTIYNRGQTLQRLPGSVERVTGDRYDYRAFEQQIAARGHFDCVIDMLCFTAEDAASAVRAFQGRTGQFIFCSTIAVYSNPATHYPITESESRKGNNAYSRGKIAAEDILQQAHTDQVLPVTTIRPGYAYGEGGEIVEPFGWGTRYIDRLRKNKPLIIHGDGTTFWGACHVDDLASTFANAVGNTTTLGQAYHVHGEEWLTWNRYYQELAEAIGAPAPRFVYIPSDLLHRLLPDKAEVIATDFNGHRLYDNTAARRDLGFRYTISWKTGAKRAVDWLDAHQRIENSDVDPFEDRLIAAWERLSTALVAEVTQFET